MLDAFVKAFFACIRLLGGGRLIMFGTLLSSSGPQTSVRPLNNSGLFVGARAFCVSGFVVMLDFNHHQATKLDILHPATFSIASCTATFYLYPSSPPSRSFSIFVIQIFIPSTQALVCEVVSVICLSNLFVLALAIASNLSLILPRCAACFCCRMLILVAWLVVSCSCLCIVV